MALACATATVTEPDLAPRPDTPREQQPAEQSWDDPLAELTRIVGPREPGAGGDELLALFRERGLAPQVQEFRTEATERSPSQVGRNLIATIGDGPRDIVVGAHYDVVRLQDGSVVGGAVDNGAASVVLTRVAETLGRPPTAPPRPSRPVRPRRDWPARIQRLHRQRRRRPHRCHGQRRRDRRRRHVDVRTHIARGQRRRLPQPPRRVYSHGRLMHGVPSLSAQRRPQLSGRRHPERLDRHERNPSPPTRCGSS